MTTVDGPPGASALADRIGYEFIDPAHLARALSHRSWCAENGDAPSNERLEFLGDAVLDLVVSEHTFQAYPMFSEGEMAKLRAAVVKASVLAEAAGAIGLGEVMLLGRGEENSGGREKQSILSDGFEALIGAIYVDGGYEPTARFVIEALGDHIEHAAAGPGVDDYKTRLQELAARRYADVPQYDIDEQGPDHRKRFSAEVRIGGEVRGHGEGRSKKLAEQAAAAVAWDRLVEESSPATDRQAPSGASDHRAALADAPEPTTESESSDA